MKKSLKTLISHVHHFGVPLPHRISRRAENFYAFQKAQKIAHHLFDSVCLDYHQAGFWFVSPMPSQTELTRYYAAEYWATRDDRKVLLRDRDVAHLNLLLEADRSFLLSTTPKTTINFGAGHGGVSYLFHAQGFKVINVDPYPGNIEFFDYQRDLCEIVESVDLIYASHSLEHVTDALSTIQEFDRLLKDGGYIFIEVPNPMFPSYSMLDSSGERKPVIQIPHTQYFSLDFFANLDYDIILLSAYKYEGNSFGLATSPDDGEVIRFLGRKRKRN